MGYEGYLRSGEQEIGIQIIRMGAKNSRIIVDGVEKLVPTECVRRKDEASNDPPCRILPTVPLERLYRKFRKQSGSKAAKFDAIVEALNGRHGAKDACFLAELFRRSVALAAFYENIESAFYPGRSTGSQTGKYASELVYKLSEAKTVTLANDTITWVDYEIFPFRTTLSCTELGESAKSTAGGGMDLLLRSGAGLPVVGEIKANTEHVGPTFALVQSLMYASQSVSYTHLTLPTTPYV